MLKPNKPIPSRDRPAAISSCDKIKVQDKLCHHLRFNRFVLASSTDKPSKYDRHKGPVKYAIVQPQYLGLDSDEEIDAKHIEATINNELKRLEQFLPTTRDVNSGLLPDPISREDIAKKRQVLADRKHNTCSMPLNDQQVVQQYQQAITQAQALEIEALTAPMRRTGIMTTQAAKVQDLRKGISEMYFPPVSLPLDSMFPHICFNLVFEQQWCHRGYTRGEKIDTIGLAPGDEITLEVHSWTKTHFKSERELAMESELTLSSSLTARDHLEVATKIASQTGYGSNSKIGLSLPIEGIPIEIGGGVNFSQTFTGELNSMAQQTNESTQTAVNAIKSQRKLRIEQSKETGQDNKKLRKVVNTNRCHSLNIHYFEVLSNYQVELKLVDVIPCVLQPMPRDVVTSQWALCHEHILKSVLLDKVFLTGFSAAKTIETQQALDEMADIESSIAPESPTAGSSRGASGNIDAEMARHRDNIVSSFEELLENERGAQTGVNDLMACNLFDPVCYTRELDLLASKMPKLIYLTLLRLNRSAYNGMQLLVLGQTTTPALEAVRNLSSTITARDYQYNMVSSTLSKALDALGLPEKLVDIIIWGNLIDLVSDDCGLHVSVKSALASLTRLNRASVIADTEQQVSASFDAAANSPTFAQPLSGVSLLEQAQAQVEFERFKCHIEQNRNHYFGAIWSRSNLGISRGSLFPELGSLLSHNPIGYVGDKAALAITKPAHFKRWFDVELIAKIKQQWNTSPPSPFEVSLPTTGHICETTVGECNACEDYIVNSRAIDLQQRTATANQAQSEATRRGKRLSADDFASFEPCCESSSDNVNNEGGEPHE